MRHHALTRLILAACAITLAVPAMAAAQGEALPGLDRARSNYQALLDGRKQLHELSPAEQRDIVALRRLLATDTRSPYERCMDDQRRRLGDKVESDLDRRHMASVCSNARRR